MSPRLMRVGAAALVLVAGAGTGLAQTDAAAEPAPAPAAPAVPPATITLSSGETLSGEVKSVSDKEVVFVHPVLGELKIAREKIANSNAPLEQLVPPPPPPPPEPSFWKGWKGNVALGLNGSSGNTERLSFRGAVGLERLTTKMETRVTASYVYATDDGEKSEDNARLDLRNDWLTGTKWRYFAQAFLEYDDFQDWDLRIGGYVGVGYEFIKTEKTLLLGRVGIGASREIGGSDNAWTPEGLIGVDFNQQLTDSTRFTSSVDFFPSLSDMGQYRFTAKAALETMLDKESNMFFKVGVEDRYDSTPNGAKRNDLDYFALIGWNF